MAAVNQHPPPKDDEGEQRRGEAWIIWARPVVVLLSLGVIAAIIFGSWSRPRANVEPSSGFIVIDD